ncbi:MAG: FkbM family methyltransferase [Candidatus Bathyarchaeia archaeon]
MNDVCSDAIFTGSYETAERRFVERFLKEGMTVLDIGAHHGFYTILAAKKVGPSGRVIAFEPSPRERRRLLRHLKLNRCTNVKVEPLALASKEGETTLFLVDGRDTGCNSLRPPAVSEPTKEITVSTMALDSYLEKEGIYRVDFIKMDVEGAELEVLKGAKRFLERTPRPVILCEVDDYRTRAWGYPARAIIKLLEDYGYQWFGLSDEGGLVPLDQRDSYNLVAIPKEEVAGLLIQFS